MVSVTEDGRAVRRPRARAVGLDEPRRFDRAAAGRLPRRPPARTRPPTPPPPTRTAACTASSSTPRSSTPPHGREILRNFVVDDRRRAARPGPRPTSSPPPSRRSGAASTSTAARPGTDGKVLCALSGGVDSAVAATLVHRAVGDRLICVHVDHGMMRKNETELLATAFEQLGVRGHRRRTPASGSCASSTASSTRSRSATSSATSSSASSRRRPPGSAGSTS